MGFCSEAALKSVSVGSERDALRSGVVAPCKGASANTTSDSTVRVTVSAVDTLVDGAHLAPELRGDLPKNKGVNIPSHKRGQHDAPAQTAC